MLNKIHSGHWILLIAFLFLSFIFLMIFNFINKDVSMVTPDYYGQELIYNQRQEAMRRTLPFDSLFVVKRHDDHLEVTIPESINQSLQSGSIQIYCASHAEQDASFTIQPTSSNIYELDNVIPRANYTIKFLLHAGSKDYYKELKM